MPRAMLNLQAPKDLRAVGGQWRFAPGLVPGQPNEGLVAGLAGSPARLADYDDSGSSGKRSVPPPLPGGRNGSDEKRAR